MSRARHRKLKILVVASALLLGVAAGATQIGLLTPDVARAMAPEITADPAPRRYDVVISAPAGPPRVDTGGVDANGDPVTASCTTCHATRPPDPENDTADELDAFHQGLTFVHGDLACIACHDPTNYDELRLASGAGLPYPEVMRLCSQCHGTQARDYEHGAHGGMTGYWDLTRGPRERNNCIDCHDAHAPAFPRMLPTFKPRDRFLYGSDHLREDE